MNSEVVKRLAIQDKASAPCTCQSTNSSSPYGVAVASREMWGVPYAGGQSPSASEIARDEADVMEGEELFGPPEGGDDSDDYNGFDAHNPSPSELERDDQTAMADQEEDVCRVLQSDGPTCSR